LRSKRLITRFRRFAVNKVFISKAELKHTSSKVIITLYVYNEERRILLNKINKIENKLFSYTDLSLKKKRVLSIKEKLDILLIANKIKNEKNNLNFFNFLSELYIRISEEIKNVINIESIKDRKEKELEIEMLKLQLKNLKNIVFLCEKYSNYNKHFKKIFYGKDVKNILLEKEILIIAYYKLLINLNKSKFEDEFLLKLKPLISKIYNKEVEFNIVNLKAIYLNSHIFTQVISLKLKDRKNGLLKVLRSFLYMVKLPKVNILKEKFVYINPKSLLENKIKNIRVNNLFFNTNSKDNLNGFLLNIFKSSNFLLRSMKLDNYILNKEFFKDKTVNLLSSVLNSLNYKKMGGIRLEAKGRLTRRLTASRSLFKIRWKGSLKNMDSSYRGLSSVILRGHNKSNVQYSIVNSKTRNGSFGLKG
jgi:hypothetical protein